MKGGKARELLTETIGEGACRPYSVENGAPIMRNVAE
jgi:hypothetical protein